MTEKTLLLPYNWRVNIDKKLYNEDYTVTENDKVIVCKTNTAVCNVTLFDPSIFEQVDEFNRYTVYNGIGVNDVCVTIENSGIFFQGTDKICIAPGSGITFSVINVYDDDAMSFVNAWAILNETTLVSEIDEQSTVDIGGISTFTVQLAQPVKNDANITVNEIDDELIINDDSEYTIKSCIRLIDDLPSKDTVDVWVKIYNSSDVSIRQEMKQYSLSGDQTESMFEFNSQLVTGDYIKWEIETLTNFDGKYQIVSIEIKKQIKGFG